MNPDGDTAEAEADGAAAEPVQAATFVHYHPDIAWASSGPLGRAGNHPFYIQQRLAGDIVDGEMNEGILARIRALTDTDRNRMQRHAEANHEFFGLRLGRLTDVIADLATAMD
eukprot:569732-Heterocapsa_arctica.AAC.1